MSENKYLRTIVKALDDKKGNDIRVIRISCLLYTSPSPRDA